MKYCIPIIKENTIDLCPTKNGIVSSVDELFPAIHSWKKEKIDVLWPTIISYTKKHHLTLSKTFPLSDVLPKKMDGTLSREMHYFPMDERPICWYRYDRVKIFASKKLFVLMENFEQKLISSELDEFLKKLQEYIQKNKMRWLL